MVNMSKLAPIVLAGSFAACLPYRSPARTPQPPVCVEGGPRPVEQSLDDYGATYTQGMNGPAPSAPDTWLVARKDAGPVCVAPPWWQPEEIP